MCVTITLTLCLASPLILVPPHTSVKQNKVIVCPSVSQSISQCRSVTKILLKAGWLIYKLHTNNIQCNAAVKPACPQVGSCFPPTDKVQSVLA